MGALAGQRGQVQRQRGGERFAFAGLHFGDRAMMQGDAAEQLHVEVPHVERAAAGFAHQGERLGQQCVERLAAFGPIAQGQAALAKLFVGLLLELVFQGSNYRHQLRPMRKFPFRRRNGERREAIHKIWRYSLHGVVEGDRKAVGGRFNPFPPLYDNVRLPSGARWLTHAEQQD